MQASSGESRWKIVPGMVGKFRGTVFLLFLCHYGHHPKEVCLVNQRNLTSNSWDPYKFWGRGFLLPEKSGQGCELSAKQLQLLHTQCGFQNVLGPVSFISPFHFHKHLSIELKHFSLLDENLGKTGWGKLSRYLLSWQLKDLLCTR